MIDSTKWLNELQGKNRRSFEACEQGAPWSNLTFRKQKEALRRKAKGLLFVCGGRWPL